MPVDTTSETTEQQVSTVEENSLKQSKPDLPDIELNDDDPNEPTPSTSKNVLTDGLKRPLPDGVDGDKEKKIRLTEVSEDKLEVTNKDDNKESDIELLLQKVSESLENTIDDESNVSNKIPLPDGVDGDKEKKIRLTEVSEDKLEVTNKDDNKESDIELLLQKVSESLENTIDDESNVSNKIPLPDGVDGDKEKKIRLTEVSEDKLEVTNKDDNKESHIELLLQNVSESLENTIDDESNVSNKTHDNLKNEKNPSFNLINHNGNNGIDDKDCKEDYLDKNTLSKDISKGKKKYNPSANDVEKNLNDSSEFIENSKDIVKNGNNILTSILTKDILTSNVISCLNKSSSSENLAITENSDPESVAVVNDTQVTENISTAVNDSTVRESNSNLSNTNIYTIENIVNSKKDDANPLLELKNKIHLTKNTDETKSIESPSNSNTNNSEKADVCSNGIDQNFEAKDSENSSDITDLPEDSIKSGVKQITEESLPQLLKLLSDKDLTFEQFDSMCSEKVHEIMASKSFFRNDFLELEALKEKEKLWRKKYFSLNKDFEEIKHFLNVKKKKDGSMKLPKQAIPLPRPDPVSIAVEDDDDVVELEFETVESATSSTSKITNTTKKKQIPPLITTSKTLIVSPKKNVTASAKNVSVSPKSDTPAKSLNHINIGTTINLTENDDVIEESNIINLEDSISPIKIPRQIPASLLPAGTLVNGDSEKTITYLELSKNPSSSSSSFITGTASRSPRQTSVLNKDTLNTSPKSKKLEPISIEVSHVDPALVQPCTVTYTAHCVPVSGTLQPMTTASYAPRTITISQLSASLKTLTPSYTTCQITASGIPGSMPGIALPQASSGTSCTTCRVPISLCSIHHKGSQSTRKPSPPAIPLLGHSPPVPGIPNQRSLSTWKGLPPAPHLTILKSPEVQNMPQALVLSWTMNVNGTIAEVISYQIYAYQETPDQPPNIDLWKKIGDVNALPLPMACSLTHLSNGQKYHFIVRAVDVYTRVGPFSTPESIIL